LETVPTRARATPGLDWVVSATEPEMLAFLGGHVPCPRCGGTLRQDPLWSTPNLADEQGHTFSNVRALVVELYQRGMLGPDGLTPGPAPERDTAAQEERAGTPTHSKEAI
jgi:hypothetical protein